MLKRYNCHFKVNDHSHDDYYESLVMLGELAAVEDKPAFDYSSELVARAILGKNALVQVEKRQVGMFRSGCRV